MDHEKPALDLSIEHEADRLTLRQGGAPVGRLDWRVGDRLIHIDFVYVDPSRRGHGLGVRLVDAAAEYARSTARRLVPICGYAGRVLQSGDRYRDVLEEREPGPA